MISLKECCGIFASWAIRQSPYVVPQQLPQAIEYFNDHLIQMFAPYIDSIGSGWICIPHDSEVEIDNRVIYRRLYEIFQSSKFKQCNIWNEPVNQDRKLRNHRRFVLGEEHPDDDFIDLSALARNISQDMWREGNISVKYKKENGFEANDQK